MMEESIRKEESEEEKMLRTIIHEYKIRRDLEA